MKLSSLTVLPVCVLTQAPQNGQNSNNNNNQQQPSAGSWQATPAQLQEWSSGVRSLPSSRPPMSRSRSSAALVPRYFDLEFDRL
jgi:hypothetical protein